MQSAARVGGLVILFFVLVVGVYATLQRNAFAPESQSYKVVFADAGGLTSGSRVTLAGVLVGQVESVELRSARQAVATISIRKPHQIPGGSSAVLPSSLISIGDREVQIIPGDGPNLSPGAEIPGTLLSAMDGLLPDTKGTLDEMNKTMVSLQKLLNDRELTGGVKELMASGVKTSDQFGQLADTMDSSVRRNEKKFVAILESTSQSMANISAMTEELKVYLAKGEMQEEAGKLLKSLNAAAEEGTKLVKELNAVVADPDLRASLKGTAANTKTMSESGVKITADVAEMTESGKSIAKKTDDLLTKANQLADEVKGTLGDFKKTVDKVVGGDRNLFPKVSPEADIFYNGDRKIQTDFNFSFSLGGEKFRLGLYDAFEGNKLNAQFERSLAEGLDLRYGVYASKPGFGVDYAFAPKLALRGDLFGLNDPRFDLRLRYDLGKSLHGWLGVDRVFDRNSPMVGIGIRR